MKIVKRKDAIANNLPKYFTNKPCKHGHIAERYLTNGACVECIRLSTTDRKKEIAEASLKYYHKHKVLKKD